MTTTEATPELDDIVDRHDRAFLGHPRGSNARDAKIGLFWPVMFHLLNSIGFSHILPVSLALFTRLAPRQLNAARKPT